MTRGVTRLAPSPTGALHLGNARTFLATWALARSNGWRIVLRVEDLDTPRVKPGVIDLTIDLLSWLGIDWDAGPYIQSADRDEHARAMRRLAAAGLVYPCAMSRTEIEAAASAPQEGSGEVRFPASLRPPSRPCEFDDASPSWRFVVEEEAVVRFDDAFAGPQAIRPASSIGDFIVWTRRDPAKPGQAAYQLAVVVDDARHGVTHVVRGDDLLDSAARQTTLIHALGMGPQPTYCHLPLVRGEDGKRLAKRHGDTRLDMYRAAGVTPQRVIGLVASWCGMLPSPRPMDAREFLATFDLNTIPRQPIIFTAADDRWLRARPPA